MTVAYDLNRQTRFDQIISCLLPGYVISIYTLISAQYWTYTHTSDQTLKFTISFTILQRTLSRTLTTTTTHKMPLVVPGLQSKDGKGDEWMSKLMGKSIGHSHTETVCSSPPPTLLLTYCPLFPLACPCHDTAIIQKSRMQKHEARTKADTCS